MALTEVGSPTVQLDSDVTDVTVNRTVTAGSTGLTISIAFYNGAGTVVINSVNWNTSEAATLFTNTDSSNAGGDYKTGIYHRVNPTSGAHSVTIAFSGNVYARTTVREWSNLNTTTPGHDGNKATSDSATATVDISSVVAGEITIDACVAGNTLTAGAGQSTDQNGVLVGGINGATGSDPTSTGTVTESYTVGGGGAIWTIGAVALSETAAGGGAASDRDRGIYRGLARGYARGLG